MELLQLSYFCDAAECENISRTAEKYNVPPSGVSQSVKRLERELGVPLFNRTANKISLNEEGRIFYEAAKRALSALEGAARRLSESESEVGGEIRLLIETNRRIVTLAIEKFKSAYPAVSFVIHHTDSGRADSYDLIVSDRERIGARESVPLMSERILLAVNRSSPLAKRGSLALSELSGERFVSMGAPTRIHALTHKICREEGFTPNVVISTDDPFYVRKYVEMGMGVALVPEVSWRGLFSEDIALISVGEYKRNINLILPPDGLATRGARLFCDCLRETFALESKNA